MALPELIKDIDARVIRPASTDNAIVRFDGTTGLVLNTGNIIDDNNNVTFLKIINSGTICINGRNFNNEISTATTGGTIFGIEYDDINHLPEDGIVSIRGTSGSFGLASHCSYTDGTSENIIGKRCFYKNAENNYHKNNNLPLTPTALILKEDGHLKYYIGNTKVYSKNEEVIMNEYEVLHTGNISLMDNRFVKKSGDTMTGPLSFGTTSTTNGPQIRFFSNKRNYIWMGYANDNGYWYLWDSHNNKGIITSTNAGVNYFYGNADTATKATLDGNGAIISSTYAKLATGNNLIHSGNEFTFVPGSYNNLVYLNYRTASGNLDGNITQYNFCNGKGGTLASISNGQFSGNAATATKLLSARTISLTGDVTGSGTFDGSANLAITATVADNSHNHAASNITSGTLAVARGGTGQTTVTPAVGTKGVRQIYAGTSDMTAGSTALTTGVVYFVYE